MKHIFNFYKKHKLAALFTALWFLFMTYITVSGLRNESVQDPVEVGSGIFAGIVMFIPVALIIAALSAMLSKIFGTLREIVHINGTDNNDLIEPVVSEGSIPTPEISPEPVIKPEPEIPQLPVYDTMEGHDFEYYCADLLKNNGFYNVSVTQGSGDQGIDVLAEKGGVKYGIQCKCYSNFNENLQESFVYAVFQTLFVTNM